MMVSQDAAMPEDQLDAVETEVLTAYDSAAFASVASTEVFERIRAAARATGRDDPDENVGLSSAGPAFIRALALRRGVARTRRSWRASLTSS